MSAHTTIDWDDVRARLSRSAERTKRAATSDPELMERVFRRRAEALARRGSSDTDVESIPVVAFQLRGERYLLNAGAVSEVIVLGRCTRVPGATSEIVGVANVRGEAMLVVALADVLGLPSPTETSRDGYVVVLRRTEGRVGFLVDAVEAVRDLRTNDVEKRDASAAMADRAYVQGFAPEGLIVLDEIALLAHPVFEEAP